MGMCTEHWTQLREAIEKRGLGDLIASDGGVAMEQMKDQLERARRDEEELTLVNYDPLMSAFWAVLGNAGRFLDRAGAGGALYVMTDGPEDPIEGFPNCEGKTWPRCAICYLNLAHKLTCTDPRCKLDTERGYDWFIDRAADDQVQQAAKLREAATDGR